MWRLTPILSDTVNVAEAEEVDEGEVGVVEMEGQGGLDVHGDGVRDGTGVDEVEGDGDAVGDAETDLDGGGESECENVGLEGVVVETEMDEEDEREGEVIVEEMGMER